MKKLIKSEYIYLVIQLHPDEGALLYHIYLSREDAHKLAEEMNEKYRDVNFKWIVKRKLIKEY